MTSNSESNDSIVVLVVDRLAAAYLGPYGNTSLDTPALNRLATRGILFDQAIAARTDLPDAYNQWLDQRTAQTSTNVNSAWTSQLLTDDPVVAQHSFADCFEQLQLVAPEEPATAAADIGSTQLATFLAHATECLSAVTPRSIQWLHCRGMSGPWDAPYDVREALAHPDDPPPPTFVAPPSQWLDPTTADPDQLLGFEQAYTAQVKLLDQLLSVPLDQLDEDPALANTWFIFTATRGYPLGQHGVVGDAVDPHFGGTMLHQENVHVPLIVCPPARWQDQLAGHRCGHLFSLDDLVSLIESIQTSSHSAFGHMSKLLTTLPDANHQWSLSRNGEAAALQTLAWKLVRESGGAGQSRLYVKPDDRWEVNDVSDRCSTVLAELQAMLPIANAGGKIVLPEIVTRGMS